MFGMNFAEILDDEVFYQNELEEQEEIEKFFHQSKNFEEFLFED